MASRRSVQRGSAHYPVETLIQHFRGNWCPEERELLALPPEERKRLFMPLVTEVLAAHREWFKANCTRPRIWWELAAPEPRDEGRFQCQQLHDLGELTASEQANYAAALEEAEERFDRAWKYYQTEVEYHAQNGHWRTSGGEPWKPTKGQF